MKTDLIPLLSLMRFPESPLREILFLSFIFHNNTRKAGIFMTCYDSKSGSFPISRKDCELLASACEEQVIEMEKDLEAYGAKNICVTKNSSKDFSALLN